MHGHVPQETNAMGTKWQSVTGRLAMVSVGWSGVWGVTPTQEVPPSQADINRASVRAALYGRASVARPKV